MEGIRAQYHPQAMSRGLGLPDCLEFEKLKCNALEGNCNH